MASVSLALLKKHVNADEFNADDALLQQYLDAAVESVRIATNRSMEDLSTLGYGDFPAPLAQAVYMLAAHWYNQRESVAAVQMHEVPDALQSLVKPYRKFGNDSWEVEI